MKVLVIGSGGREHAISWKLAQSSLVDEVICVPGNGGTQHEPKCRNVAGVSAFEDIAALAKKEQCAFAVVGPEDPLAAGLADVLWQNGIPTVGPKAKGANLEASKDAAKTFMAKYGVACAESASFTDAASAHAYIDEKGAPIVIKADGLAAGKGVVVAADAATAHSAIDDFMGAKTLGDAGNCVVIEDYLQGVEISILAAVSVTKEMAAEDKCTIVPFTTARDHKRLLDGAKGPNTGGMGAISPVSDVTEEDLAAFRKTILEPTLRGLVAEEMDYRGFIFFGLMLTKNGPKLLEYNVRLGDPETQAVLPLMDFDFAAMCQAIIDGSLKNFGFAWKPGFVCAPVAVSGGYPKAYGKGYEITYDKEVFAAKDAKLFVAGAKCDDKGTLLTSGGRVLASSAYGDTFEKAWQNAYAALETVSFKDIFFRKDIGLPGAAESGEL